MLIHISDSIIEAVERNDHKALETVELVAQSMKYGNHYLFASRQSIIRLLNVGAIGPQSKIVLNHILSNYAVIGNIINCVSLYVELIFGQSGPMSIHDTPTHHVIQISHSDFLNSDLGLTVETVLLVENTNDADFYHHIAKYYQYKKGLGDISLKYNPECGGGSTTCMSYLKYVKTPNRFCLCISDTDKKHAGASVGDTIKRIIKIDNIAKSQAKLNSHLVDTNLREIENLLPYGLLPELSNQEPEKGQLIQAIYDANKEAFLYFDIKNGITKKAYKNLVDQYLLPIIDALIINLRVCDRATLTDIKSIENPEGVIIAGLGEKIMSQYIKKCLSKKYDEIDNALVTEQRIEWLRIGEIANNWMCAYPRIRS